MKTIFKALVIFTVLVLSLASCDLLMPEDDPIEIKGDWADSFDGVLSVSEKSVTMIYAGATIWVADIADYDNEEWNGSETGTGDCGYAVMQYTQASSYVPESQDKYMVLRWQNLSSESGTVTLSYAEGYGDYFEDAQSAVSGATTAAGYFTFFTDGAVKQ